MAQRPVNTGSRTTENIVLNDAPQLEPALVLQLHDRSLWEKFKKSVKGLNPANIVKRLTDEKERIMKEVDKRGYITKDEADFLNQNMKESLEAILEEFKQEALRQLQVQPGDKPEEVKFKISFSAKLLTWLTDLFQWLIGKIKAIFAKILESIEWCWEKANELFNYLFSLLKF